MRQLVAHVTRQPVNLGERETGQIRAIPRHRHLEKCLYPRRIGLLRQLLQNTHRRRHRRFIGDQQRLLQLRRRRPFVAAAVAVEVSVGATV